MSDKNVHTTQTTQFVLARTILFLKPDPWISQSVYYYKKYDKYSDLILIVS